VPTRLIHVSDLHVGAREERSAEAPLRELVDRLRPDLIVASGDLTHRGTAEQHERAAAFLRDLEAPVLALPGNHDIPHTPKRFTRPWQEFERHWQTTEPVFRSEELVVVGLNSARPWRHQSGGLADDTLRGVATRLADAPASALRVVCLHHHLTGAPWRTRKRPVARRSHVLDVLDEAGAELVLSGHTHQAAVVERREFETGLPGGRRVVCVTAPGLGHPRPRRRGEARGVHVIEVDADEIRIETLAYEREAFAPVASRRFSRSR
jgi:3',5'-cyclic AMP phosphodiesterase CpdA